MKNNSIIKVNEKVRKVVDKYSHLLLNNFLLPWFRTQRSYKSTLAQT